MGKCVALQFNVLSLTSRDWLFGIRVLDTYVFNANLISTKTLAVVYEQFEYFVLGVQTKRLGNGNFEAICFG